MEYAIVDIETTGGYAANNGITEIAIYIHNGLNISLAFDHLINPQLPIPLHITSMTGIDNQMVRDAPVFKEVAQQIYDLLQGRVFVAHNVNFDYSFLKHQLHLCGYDWNAPKLCTVRLSRKFFPGLPSYSLGKLCQQLQVPLLNRHRAGGDAAATAQLFSMILACDETQWIQQNLKRTSKEQVLPPHLSQEDFDALPHCTGVYYFKNKKGKVIYVGKAKNLKKRIASHFSGQNISAQRQHFIRDIYSIDFTICGTELMALLLEAAEIQRLWPENNRALKRFEPKYGLYSYEDQNGYVRLVVDKHQKFRLSIRSFGSLTSAYNFMNQLINEHQLCPKLCAIQKIRGACSHYKRNTCFGACIGHEDKDSYNERILKAMHDMENNLPCFLLVDKGRSLEEQSCIWVEKGMFCGMGYIAYDSDLIYSEDIKTYLTPYPSNDYMMHLIMNYADSHPNAVKWLERGTLSFRQAN